MFKTLTVPMIAPVGIDSLCNHSQEENLTPAEHHGMAAPKDSPQPVPFGTWKGGEWLHTFGGHQVFGKYSHFWKLVGFWTPISFCEKGPISQNQDG